MGETRNNVATCTPQAAAEVTRWPGGDGAAGDSQGASTPAASGARGLPFEVDCGDAVGRTRVLTAHPTGDRGIALTFPADEAAVLTPEAARVLDLAAAVFSRRSR